MQNSPFFDKFLLELLNVEVSVASEDISLRWILEYTQYENHTIASLFCRFFASRKYAVVQVDVCPNYLQIFYIKKVCCDTDDTHMH